MSDAVNKMKIAITKAKHLTDGRLSLADDDIKAIEQRHLLIINDSKREGEKRGKIGLPEITDDIDIYESNLNAQYTGLFVERVQNERSVIVELNELIDGAKSEEQGGPLKQIHEEINDLKKRINDRKIQIKRIQNSFDRCKMEYDRPEGQIKAQPWFVKHSYLPVILMVLIALVEFPLNYMVFGIFRMDNKGTLMVACTLLIALPSLGHFNGLAFKRIKDAENAKRNRNLAIITTLAIMFLVFMLSYLRTFFILNQNGSNSVEALLNTISGSDTTSNSVSVLTFSDIIFTKEFWGSLVINSVLFASGSFVSFMSHDISETFEKCYKEHEFILPEYEIQNNLDQQSIGRKSAMIAQRMNEDENLKTIWQLRLEAIQEHNKLVSHVKDIGKIVEQKFKHSLSVYRQENELARKMKNIDVPDRIWKNIPELRLELHENSITD